MSDTYVYLKNLQGVTIKPVTDLSAINLTTGDGIGVKGNTIGVVAGYVAQTAYTELTDPATAANPDSGYIEGGTMYTLLGGYAVTSDVPPATAASEYRVPSEKAVREAIDAYVATGGSDIVAGKGIDMGGGQINATEATVEETLKGYTVSGGTTTVPFDDQVVMPYDLRGALSLGQAVDVTCEPGVDVGTLTYSTNIAGKTATYLDTITWSGTYSTLPAYFGFGSVSGVWYHYFPKGAPGLKYLFVFDFVCDKACWLGYYSQSFNVDILNVLNRTYPANTKVRVGMMFEGRDATAGTVLRFSGLDVGTAFTATITNCRQYEVTALTDDAILALATAEDPDAWFRANARSVNERYLVKPDMVSPWVPIIRMSTNSTALTVGAGLAYAVDVFGGSYTIGVDTFPEDAYGQDAHLELFVKAGSHVTFQPPLSLMDPLQENAGHNITIKFREGRATAYVDDTNYGYIIDVPEGTAGTQAGGSLYFAISGSTSNYAIFSAQLDGSTVTTPSVTANKDITIMGNGTDKTFISGTFGAASGKQLIARTLSIVNSTISGAGGITVDGAQLGDVVVASGSTINFAGVDVLDGTVSGAGQIVFVNGSTLTGTDATKKIETQLAVTIQRDTSLDSLTYTVHGSHWLVDMYGTLNACTITDCSGEYGILRLNPGAMLKDCIVSGNTATSMYPIYILGDALGDLTDVIVSGCTFSNTVVIPSWNINDITVYCGEHNKIENCLFELPYSGTGGGVYVQAGRDRGNPVVSISGSTFNAALIVESYTADGSNGTAILDGYNIINNEIYGTGIVKIVAGGTVSGAGLIRGVKLSIMPSTPPDKETTISIALHTPLDASAATTVQLTGTTFTSGSLISKSPSQIQLPTNSINSFSGNTTSAGTKILKAGTIIVGDDRTNPTGSATIEFVGGSTTLSGIGTYIAKDGTNDFVPIAGNVTSVTTATGTGAGSLQYALTSGTKYAKLANNLVASATFAAATNIVNKDIVTSEYQKVLGGTYSVSSGAVLTVNEATKTATIGGAQLKLVDAEIPSGATVSVSGGGLAVEKVSGNGGVIDLDGYPTSVGYTFRASGVTVFGGLSRDGVAAFRLANHQYNGTFESCTFAGCSNGTGLGGAVYQGSASQITYDGCVFVNNAVKFPVYGAAVYLYGASPKNVAVFKDCTFEAEQTVIVREVFDSAVFQGTNKTLSFVQGSGTVTLTSGAILDLTGNTNATPIAPGGGITFAPGGATVLTGATAGVVDAQYSMYNVTLPAGAKLTNTNVVDFRGGPGITNNANITASASGCTLRGALATTGACDIYGSIAFTDCTIESNYVGSGGSAREIRLATGSASFNGCTIGSGGIIVAETGGTMSFAGNNTILGKGVVAAGTASATVTISSGASINLTNSIINPGGTGGITVLTGGCTVNGNAIPAGTYTSIDSNGQAT